jgi:ATP-dependent Clp protease ATP-binding subunit ClpC
MAKINVYLPDDLEREVRDAGLSVSPICQAALRDALDRLTATRAGDPRRGGFTPRLAAILDDARDRMAASGRTVDAHEVVGAILQHGANVGARALTLLGVELPERRPARGGKGTGELAPDAKALLEDALRVSLDMRHDRLGTEHVMIAAASDGSPLQPLFEALGVQPSALRRQVERIIADPWTDDREPAEVPQSLLDRLDGEVQRLAAELGELRDRKDR